MADIQGSNSTATTFNVVNLNSQDVPGSLVRALRNVESNPGNYIVDFKGLTGTINLTEALPVLDSGHTVTFENANNLIISGQNNVQILTIDGANVSFPLGTNLTLQSGFARGGDGAAGGGGGGGLGAGGALTILSGSVDANGVSFVQDTAQGGNGAIAAGGGYGTNSYFGGFGGTGGTSNVGGQFNITGANPSRVLVVVVVVVVMSNQLEDIEEEMPLAVVLDKAAVAAAVVAAAAEATSLLGAAMVVMEVLVALVAAAVPQ